MKLVLNRVNVTEQGKKAKLSKTQSTVKNIKESQPLVQNTSNTENPVDDFIDLIKEVSSNDSQEVADEHSDVEEHDIINDTSASSKSTPKSDVKTKTKSKSKFNSNSNGTICKECGKEFLTPLNLKRHRVTVHERRYKRGCETCGLELANRQSYKVHIETHKLPEDKILNYSCYFCQKKFISKHALFTHIITHVKERPYACTFCPSTYVFREGLNKHLKKHANGTFKKGRGASSKKKSSKSSSPTKVTQMNHFITPVYLVDMDEDIQPAELTIKYEYNGDENCSV